MGMTADELGHRVPDPRPYRRTMTLAANMAMVIVMHAIDDVVVMLVRHRRPFEIERLTSKVLSLR